jgi:hypothetical protein
MSTQLPIEWKCGNEWAPFHPQASHIRPDYRDGWNAAYAAAQSRISELEQQLAEAQAKLQQQALEYLSLCGQQDEALRQLEEAKKDAERYRWLRARHWSDSPLCVVANPKAAVRLGHECPSGERLDAAIDSAIGGQENNRD